MNLQTTFVLKRRTPVPLYKKNQAPVKLRARHFNYDLIEDTNIAKKANIDVILTTYIEGFGNRGEIVNVKPTIAYNKLLLPGFAAYVTPANIAKYAKKDGVKEEDEVKHSSQFAQRVS